MATTTVPPPVSLAEVARVARAPLIESLNRAQPRQPSEAAAGTLGPAVVNHVRAPDATSKDAAVGGEAEQEHADEIRALAKRDAEVRAHEQAHAAAGGAFAGAPSYEFQRGPDGRSYAVSGEVPIDVSPISGDPEATIQKMQQVKRAALAPQKPSDADRAIAATADALIMAARTEQATEKNETSTQDSQPDAGAAAREVFSAYERRAGAQAYAAAS